MERLLSVDYIKKRRQLLNVRIVIEGKKYCDDLNHFPGCECDISVIKSFTKMNKNIMGLFATLKDPLMRKGTVPLTSISIAQHHR